MSVRNHSVQYVGNYMLILTEAEREVSKIIWHGKTFIPEKTCILIEDEYGRTSCGECGAHYLCMTDAVYCPDCGAKVIRNGERA